MSSRVYAFHVLSLTFFCSILLSNIESVAAQNAEPEDSTDLHMLVEQTMDACYREDFARALELANQVCDEYPDVPAGPFGLLTTYQTISRNYRIRYEEEKVDSLLNVSIELAKKALKRNKKDGISYFYLGTALGFRSMFNAQHGKWMDAFKDGTQVLQNFNKAVAYSPEFYDAYYGIGLYKYWLNAKGPMRILPFSKKNRAEGFAQMKITAAQGRFLKTNAKYGLMAAYLNEEEYKLALEMGTSLLESFPQNPTLNYRLGRIYERQEKWEEALASYKELHKILAGNAHSGAAYKVECLYRMAVCNYEMQNMLEAQRLCQDAMLLEKHIDTEKDVDGPNESISEIQDSLHDLSEDVKATVVSSAPGKRTTE